VHQQQQLLQLQPYLQRHDLLVALVEPSSEGNHDVALLQ
jgi:hypothetical protein